MNEKLNELKATAYDVIARMSQMQRQSQQLQEQLVKVEEEIKKESMKPIKLETKEEVGEVENDNKD